MRQTKSIMPDFAFHDRTGIQKYLEKQAAKGWMLTQLGKYRWKFHRAEPRKLRFAVVYFPEADLFDPAPGEEEETFREFCAHSGWKLAGANAQLQIFYSDREDPTPIETDPLLEVENIHRAMKKGSLPGYWLLILCAVLMLGVQGMAIRNNPLQFLSGGISLFGTVAWLLLLVMTVYHLAHYYLWRRKAVTMAREQNLFLETKSGTGIPNLLAALLTLSFLGLVLTMKDWTMAVILVISVGACFGIQALTELVRKKMRKDGWDAHTNRKTTLLVTVALFFLLHSLLVPALIRNTEPSRNAGRENGLRIKMWDLLGGEPEDYDTFFLTDQESLVLGYQRIHQVPLGTINTDLQYELAEVKADFLYPICLRKIMTVPAYIENGAFREINPENWGADKVWQLFEGEKERQWYVICRDNIILEIITGWDLTDEQIAVLAESIK